MRFWKIRSRCPNYPWFMSCSVSSSHMRTWMASPFRMWWKISSILTFKSLDWKQTMVLNKLETKHFCPSFWNKHWDAPGWPCKDIKNIFLLSRWCFTRIFKRTHKAPLNYSYSFWQPGKFTWTICLLD